MVIKDLILNLRNNILKFVIVLLIGIAIFYLRNSLTGYAQNAVTPCPAPTAYVLVTDLSCGCNGPNDPLSHYDPIHSTGDNIDSDRISEIILDIQTKCSDYCIETTPPGGGPPNSDCVGKLDTDMKHLICKNRYVQTPPRTGRIKITGHDHMIPCDCELPTEESPSPSDSDTEESEESEESPSPSAGG